MAADNKTIGRFHLDGFQHQEVSTNWSNFWYWC
jgi:hypothetical protein